MMKSIKELKEEFFSIKLEESRLSDKEKSFAFKSIMTKIDQVVPENWIRSTPHSEYLFLDSPDGKIRITIKVGSATYSMHSPKRYCEITIERIFDGIRGVVAVSFKEWIPSTFVENENPCFDNVWPAAYISNCLKAKDFEEFKLNGSSFSFSPHKYWLYRNHGCDREIWSDLA